MSTTARKARKRIRHQAIRDAIEAFGDYAESVTADRAESLRFTKPAKVGTPLFERIGFFDQPLRVMEDQATSRSDVRLTKALAKKMVAADAARRARAPRMRAGYGG